jgi:hypothetical protein
MHIYIKWALRDQHWNPGYSVSSGISAPAPPAAEGSTTGLESDPLALPIGSSLLLSIEDMVVDSKLMSEMILVRS